MSQIFASGGLSIGASASVLPMNIQDWFPFKLTGLISCSPRDSQESSPTPQFKSISSLALSLLYGSASHPYMTTGKNIALTIWTFVGKVMSMLFNTLSRYVIAFLPRSEHLLILWLQSPSAVIFGAQENKVCHCFHCFPIYLSWSDGTGCMFLVFEWWVLSQLFHSPLSLLSRVSLVPLLSAVRVVSSAYLRLLIFLLAILIPACASSSPAFCMITLNKLNKQGDNIRPWCTSLLIWNQSIFPCPVLTVAPWPTYRFHRRQVRWSSIPISWRIFQFVVIHPVKGRSQ